MIIVTGSVLVAPTQDEAALALALAHTHRSRAEPGCITHQVLVDAEDPRRLVFLERWADREALAAHFALPESREFMRSLRRLSEERSPLSIYEATEIQL